MNLSFEKLYISLPYQMKIPKEKALYSVPGPSINAPVLILKALD